MLGQSCPERDLLALMTRARESVSVSVREEFVGLLAYAEAWTHCRPIADGTGSVVAPSPQGSRAVLAPLEGDCRS